VKEIQELKQKVAEMMMMMKNWWLFGYWDFIQIGTYE
jgi:hypothetical protein